MGPAAELVPEQRATPQHFVTPQSLKASKVPMWGEQENKRLRERHIEQSACVGLKRVIMQLQLLLLMLSYISSQ
jgi:hypothetical protein